MKSRLFLLLFNTICLLVLLFSVRGLQGNPDSGELNSAKWKALGPFELSPERGRFALTFSLAEKQTVFFDSKIAEFATPDLGILNNRFVSLFDPGVSFLLVPGYLIGKIFGYSQLGAALTIVLFGFFNVILIQKICQKFGANYFSSALASLIYIFATPAFTYSVSIYQHQISTFLILTCIYLLKSYSRLWVPFLVGLLYGIGFLIDYPNAFLMLPLLFFSYKRFIKIDSGSKSGFRFFVNPAIVMAFLAILPPLIFLGMFNKLSYDSYFHLSGNTPRIISLNENNEDRFSTDNLERLTQNFHHENSILSSYFRTRNLLNGFYILVLSPDRGIINYAPVVLFGIAGFYSLYRKRNMFLSLLFGTVSINFLLYALWGDPWGGWSFGARYLVPAYAVLSIGIGVFVDKTRRRPILLLLLFLVFAYSTVINTAGALTSSANPPQIEVLNLEKVSGTIQKYTYQKNFDLLNNNQSKSFAFQYFGRYYLNARQYFYFISGLIILLGMYLTAANYLEGSQFSLLIFRDSLHKLSVYIKTYANQHLNPGK